MVRVFLMGILFLTPICCCFGRLSLGMESANVGVTEDYILLRNLATLTPTPTAPLPTPTEPAEIFTATPTASPVLPSPTATQQPTQDVAATNVDVDVAMVGATPTDFFFIPSPTLPAPVEQVPTITPTPTPTRRLSDTSTAELKSNTPPETGVINRKKSSGAQLLFTKQNVTLDLPMPHPQENDLIIGRVHGDRRVEVDLTPFDGLDAGVSRRHARLIKDEDQWLIEDLGSLNGTFVNDTLIAPSEPIPLKDNDLIRCSILAFIFLENPDS